MLPKFRPASLGLTASVRPSIRPVKASPPPPAPSPPRRRESGFGPRSERGAESQAAIETERYDEQEMPTAAGVQAPPSTVDRADRAPATLPREALQASPRGGRGNVMQLTFDDETQARAADDRVLEELRRETAAARQPNADRADLNVDYESLPSLEVRPPYDTFEAAFTERDPVTQARESAHVRRAPAHEEGSYNRVPAEYREPEYAPTNEQQQEEEFWGRREGSGPRSRPVPDPPHSYAAPVPSYDEDSRPWGDPPPPAAPTFEPTAPAPHTTPRPPEERGSPEFVMGVQPLRTATPDAWVHAQQPMPGQGYVPQPMQTLHMPPMQGMPAGYMMAANQQMHPQMHPQMVAAYPYMMSPSPYGQPAQQAYFPVPQQQVYAQPQPQPQPSYPRQASPGPASGPVVSTSINGRARPVSGQLTVAPSSAAAAPKVARFAWFVAGAAFGITFAFFATGFFNGGKVARDDFPPAAPLPAVTAVAPVVAAPPVAPVVMAVAPAAPVAAAVPVAQPTTPANLPNATLAPRPAPVAAPRFVPRPQAPRFSGRRAPAPSARSQGDEPAAPAAAPAPAAPSGGGDVSDLLGAGLKP